MEEAPAEEKQVETSEPSKVEETSEPTKVEEVAEPSKAEDEEKVREDEADEQVARALSAQLQEELELEETRDAALSQEIAQNQELAFESDTPVVEEMVVLQTNVHCVSSVDMPAKAGFFDGAPSVRVAVAVASDGELVATESTDLVKIDPGSKTASWGRDSIQFTLQKKLLDAPTTLCFTLYLSYADDKTCCSTYCAPFAPLGDALPLAATGLLPVSSKDGSPADWIDSSPRDHFLDDGAILTVSSTLIVPAPAGTAQDKPPDTVPDDAAPPPADPVV